MALKIKQKQCINPFGSSSLTYCWIATICKYTYWANDCDSWYTDIIAVLIWVAWLHGRRKSLLTDTQSFIAKVKYLKTVIDWNAIFFFFLKKENLLKCPPVLSLKWNVSWHCTIKGDRLCYYRFLPAQMAIQLEADLSQKLKELNSNIFWTFRWPVIHMSLYLARLTSVLVRILWSLS